jgi:hypothetical protein
MSIPVSDLRPGERVTLFCPNARGPLRKDAIFEGLKTGEELLALVASGGRHHADPSPNGFDVKADRRYGVFLTEIRGDWGLRHLLEITDAGRMRDDEGRAVYVEARVMMGAG